VSPMANLFLAKIIVVAARLRACEDKRNLKVAATFNETKLLPTI